MTGRDAMILTASVLFCEAVGFVGGLATRPSLPGWYERLRKPSFNPPNWVFAPVWTLLFAGMGVALYLFATRATGTERIVGLVFFGLQLALNLLWSFLFFAFRSPGWALVEIAALWSAVAACMMAMFRVSAWAGGLFVPYLAWVTFAAVLNGAIWWLNRPSAR